MSKTVWVDLLLALATAIGVISVLGFVLMRDTYQKLHYPTLLVCLSLPLITIAIWIQTNQFEARIRSILMLGFLFFTNGVLTHATARSTWIRKRGDWNISRQDPDVEHYKEKAS